MSGAHDMGGVDGFGSVEVEADEPVFHERWEGRVFALSLLTTSNIDAGRHAIERIDAASYLRLSYYGRWLRAMEVRLVEEGALGDGELEARIAGRELAAEPVPADRPAPTLDSIRETDAPPAFAVGDRVRTRNAQVSGHTRLPEYARGRRGVVAIVHPPFVLPDTHAHGRGENPQYVYAVRFDGRELWGESAEPGACLYLDCFESYLGKDD